MGVAGNNSALELAFRKLVDRAEVAKGKLIGDN
jgi:hypothetical protein